jgi:RNA polymerase sigma-54 factor
MSKIVELQHDFFLSGEETDLRPMILKDIAEEVGLDISTISRVASSKYVETDFGIFLLKDFFTEGITTASGEEVSNREVKKILKDAVDGEHKKKPLTDEALKKLLQDKGYNIARRTVAKYREQLNIPVARLRKEL